MGGLISKTIEDIATKYKHATIRLKYNIKDRARKELSGLEYKIYDAIWQRCGEERLYTWALTKTIAEDVGAKVETVRNYLKKIENKFFILRQYVGKFDYECNGGFKTIYGCRLIILILYPERFSKAAKDKVRKMIRGLQKKRQSGQISQNEFEKNLESL